MVVRPFVVEKTDVAAHEPAVVAEILADGTIRARNPAVRARITTATRDWATGQVAAEPWILWWQRRSTG